MKKVFYSIKVSVLALSFGFLAVSCEEKKDNPSPNTNGANGSTNTEYNGTKYAIKNGFFKNEGALDYYFDEEAVTKTHFAYTMLLTDGTPVLQNGKPKTMTDGKILIVSSLLSPGTAGFTAGTFEVAKDWVPDMINLDPQAYDAKYKNKFFSPIAIVFTDSDNDKDWQDETGVSVIDGTFKVTGTAPNFNTEYDLTLTGGRTLKGKFAGRFGELTE